MKLEMKQGAVKLGPNQTLKVLDAAGSTVCALEGAICITEEHDAKDIVLQPGGCYRLPSSPPSAAQPPFRSPERTAMRIDYVERQAMVARARRERAEAVYNLLIAPLVRLFTRRARTTRRPATTGRHVPA